MRVLSLFDGAGTLYLALKRAGIPVSRYYASEIKPFAIELTKKHFPDIIHLGDIRNWRQWNIDWKNIDLIGSGSPCQDLSQNGKKTGIYGKKSSLFFIFVDILNHVRKFNPEVKFLQENVASAPKKDIAIISKALGIKPQLIDSKMFVPQSRKRLWWSNIRECKDLFNYPYTCFELPEKPLWNNPNSILDSGTIGNSKGIFPTLTERYIKANHYKDIEKLTYRLKHKSQPSVVETDGRFRILSKKELCRLQGFPENYCLDLTLKQCGSIMGNAWTLPVVEHIIKQYRYE